MVNLFIFVFVVGYLAIVFEHTIHINKTASALLMGVIMWVCYALNTQDPSIINTELSHHLVSASEILFFLLGAMTIVELVDAHQGFKVVTSQIKTDRLVPLLMIVTGITFFLSAVLDNLTTAIVMVTLLGKIIPQRTLRIYFSGMVIISANAGGAWSALGDVTTTMLWIGGQIDPITIMQKVFLPSLVMCIIPLLYFIIYLKKQVYEPIVSNNEPPEKNGIIMFYCGIGSILFVTVLKFMTHLPPYMGILLGLGFCWVISEILNKNKDEEERRPYSVAYALSKIDASSILFFLGILLAIGVLESTHLLKNLAESFDHTIGNKNLIVIAIGIASAIIDNVPLVAASMGMYDLQTIPANSNFWHFMAYCAGTGGSILIIGSAAGVAVMGMEKINFMWYLKRFAFITLIGYLAGAGIFLLIN
jgi:Na+/H+ antiporter NhaD/arsenite permease-like protein